MQDYAYIGMEREDIDTPAALIDLDALEKNIKTVGDYYRGKKGSALRPHQKGHRLPIIAGKQIDAGAKGVSMTSLGLAEYYVNCGINDILITSEIYGRNKIRRVRTLSKHADITVGVDDIQNVRQISEAAIADNTKVNVAIELLAGPNNCGVEIPQAASLAKEIVKLRGVHFKGLWTHQGSLGGINNWEERKKAHFETLSKIETLRDEIEDAGINIEMISAGYSCTWNITPEYSGLSNVGVQAGSYVFSDWASHEAEGLEVFDYALRVLTRCISRPKPDRAMFDSGMNSCSSEHGAKYRTSPGPIFKDAKGIKEVYQREEITRALLDEQIADIKVGDVCELIPPHSDTTAKMHDRYYCIRNNRVEAIWPNYGRGLF
ncbi:MAG: alanine racemase [archaeon]